MFGGSLLFPRTHPGSLGELSLPKTGRKPSLANGGGWRGGSWLGGGRRLFADDLPGFFQGQKGAGQADEQDNQGYQGVNEGLAGHDRFGGRCGQPQLGGLVAVGASGDRTDGFGGINQRHSAMRAIAGELLGHGQP